MDTDNIQRTEAAPVTPTATEVRAAAAAAAAEVPAVATELLARLVRGNRAYLTAKTGSGDISLELRLVTAEHGQHPYAIVLTCSDSRVIPEEIFSAGIGELFVIRVAGNVVGPHELGSIVYAAEHLGCRLLLILGHTHCGAVGAAMAGGAEGYVASITHEISCAIRDETNDYKASCLNIRHSMARVREALPELCGEPCGSPEARLSIAGAIYHLDSGEVEFL